MCVTNGRSVCQHVNVLTVTNILFYANTASNNSMFHDTSSDRLGPHQRGDLSLVDAAELSMPVMHQDCFNQTVGL